MTFIIHFKDGHRETYNNRYDEDVEHERDKVPKSDFEIEYLTDSKGES